MKKYHSDIVLVKITNPQIVKERYSSVENSLSGNKNVTVHQGYVIDFQNKL